jgi:integrase
MAMIDQETPLTSARKREPWNKGKFTGAKPPLRPKHVWAIRSKLQAEARTRDLAMFNLAIDSKLRACDVVSLKVEDVAPNGYAADRATIRRRKTGQPVRFELTKQTRQAVDDYLRAAGESSVRRWDVTPARLRLQAGTRADSRLPSRRRSPRARWHGCPRAAPRVQVQR